MLLLKSLKFKHRCKASLQIFTLYRAKKCTLHMQFISCRTDCVESNNRQVMTGNRQLCGFHTTEMMQCQPSAGSHSSTGMGYNYNRLPRLGRVEERGNSRQGSRVSNYASSSGSRPIIRSKPNTVANTEAPSLSTDLTAQKPHQIPIQGAQKNAMCCISSSSDESGSDVDAEAGLGVKCGLSEVPVLAETDLRQSGTRPYKGNPTASGNSSYVAFTREMADRKNDSGVVVRRSRIQAADKMKWVESSESLSLDARKSGTAVFNALGETGGSDLIGETSDSSLITGTVRDCQCFRNSRGAIDDSKRVRFGAAAGCNCEMEGHASGQLHVLQGKGSTDNSFNRLGQPISSARGSSSKRKSCTQGVSNQRSHGTVSQGLGSRENNGPGSSVTSFSRRNLSGLSCSSTTDVPPSVSASCTDGAYEHLRHQKTTGPNIVNNGSDALRGFRLNRSSVVSSVGCTPHRNSSYGLGGFLSEQNAPSVDQIPSRSARRAASPFQAEIWCSRRATCVESDSIMSHGTLSSVGVQSPILSSLGHRRGSPLVSRGRNLIGSTSRPSEHSFPMTAADGDRLSYRCPGNSSRSSLMGSTYANRLSTAGSESSRDASRIRLDRGMSNSTPCLMLDDPCAMASSSSLSGPPPTRPPPSPRNVAQHTSSIQSSLLPPPLLASSSCPPYSHLTASDETHLPGNFSHGNGIARLSSSPDENESFNLPVGESLVHRPFHGQQLQSYGENQPRLYVEGLSEILSALEHAERDNELSYEQILMLEATLLLGGMGLHDQHRDMRLDVDSMSYEELLALEERIGNVSTGLNEEAIAKCLERRWFTCGSVSNFVPQETEVKCSICQEEFEADVELGLLECGHSHHIYCIKQWLLQKNQCPICKAPALS